MVCKSNLYWSTYNLLETDKVTDKLASKFLLCLCHSKFIRLNPHFQGGDYEWGWCGVVPTNEINAVIKEA